MVGGARRRRFTRYRCRTGETRRRVPPWIIQQNIFSECRFHGALPIPLYDMLFEMPAGLDPLPIPPNDDILLPDDDLPPPPVQKPKAKRGRKEIKFLTEDELARLFSVIPSVRDRAIFQLAYRAGLRASEVGLLQLRDYDPKADRIFIHRAQGFQFRPSPSDA